MSIKGNYQRIRTELPAHVSIVVASKTRTIDEIREVIDAGAEILGENYVQEAENMYRALGTVSAAVKWHMIGNLQKNKINKVLSFCDLVETVDSVKIANAINKRAEQMGKKLDVFIEINIGSEFTKSGILPEYNEVKNLVEYISKLKFLRLTGLMTMGPRSGDPETSRVYFKRTKEFYDAINKSDLEDTEMQYLSMGMSNSYKIAIQEGANMVRLGTAIFGERSKT